AVRPVAPLLTKHALVRGRYMKAVAWMEYVGIPIDTNTLAALMSRWDALKGHLIDQIDPAGEIWSGGSFSEAQFREWLAHQGICWPRLDTGRLKLDKETFSDMAKIFPAVQPVEQLRTTLSKMKLKDLAVGPDGRNRTLLSPFGSRSGRNQPSTSRFIFGNARWLRSLIQPQPGTSLAYIDWAQQEFGIGAVLSGDRAMVEAYRSSDPYLAFAKRAGAVPPDATKSSHPNERSTFKMVVLGVGYCMSAPGLAAKLGCSVVEAEELLQIHRQCYPNFWRWSQGAADYGFMNGMIHSRFGLQLHVTADTKDRTLRNFPSQANGAEMMRLAAIYATEAGIRVCAPVHDAFLIEAATEDLDHEVYRMQECMARASADVLDGFRLDTDADLIRHPDRFGGNSENIMWDMAMKFLN
ncbi:MAG: DNA polymerase I, partial [Verrucomicrobiae bacterium]|nr:DNA polymerase I [Verrucomicrobiae bacterium]